MMEYGHDLSRSGWMIVIMALVIALLGALVWTVITRFGRDSSGWGGTRLEELDRCVDLTKCAVSEHLVEGVRIPVA